MPIEPGDFVEFVVGEAMLVKQIEGVVKAPMRAEIQKALAEFLGNVGEVMFRVRRHGLGRVPPPGGRGWVWGKQVRTSPNKSKSS